MWYSVHFTMSGTLVTTDNNKSECGFQRECVVYNSAMDKKIRYIGNKHIFELRDWYKTKAKAIKTVTTSQGKNENSK